jgi:hypothetical protein
MPAKISNKQLRKMVKEKILDTDSLERQKSKTINKIRHEVEAKLIKFMRDNQYKRAEDVPNSKTALIKQLITEDLQKINPSAELYRSIKLINVKGSKTRFPYGVKFIDDSGEEIKVPLTKFFLVMELESETKTRELIKDQTKGITNDGSTATPDQLNLDLSDPDAPTDATQKIAELERLVTELKRKTASQENQISQLKNNTDINKLNKRDDEIAKQTQVISELKKELETVRRDKNVNSGLQKQLDATTRELNALKLADSNTNLDIELLESANSTLTADNLQLENENRALQQQLATVQAKTNAVTGNDAPVDYEALLTVQTVLGNEINRLKREMNTVTEPQQQQQQQLPVKTTTTEKIVYKELPISAMFTKLTAMLSYDTLNQYGGLTVLSAKYKQLVDTNKTLGESVIVTVDTIPGGDDATELVITDNQHRVYTATQINPGKINPRIYPNGQQFSALLHNGQLDLIKVLSVIPTDSITDDSDLITSSTDTSVLIDKSVLIVSWLEGQRNGVKHRFELAGARVAISGDKNVTLSKIKSDMQRNYDVIIVPVHGVHHTTFYDAKDLMKTKNQPVLIINGNAGTSRILRETIDFLEA